METLSSWIKHIIILVLFASFLELLIPSNSYKKFVKVIMGLLILLAVLQPVLDLMQRRWEETNSLEVTARNIAGNKNPDIADQSAQVQSERERIALDQYRKELVKQIKVIAGAIDGISDIKAEVALKEGKGEKDYGMIRKITLYAKAGNTDKDGSLIKAVKPVEVTPSIPGAQEYRALDEQKQEQIKRVVAEFYHLKAEQVAVEEWSAK